MEQREIKFRIWKPEYKQMDRVRLESYYSGRGLYDSYSGCASGIWMQFVGLSNETGTPFYEGDIITTPVILANEKHVAVGVITYLTTGFKSVGIGEYKGGHYPIQYNSTILGNIYEHPHLLENAILSPAKTTEP